MNTVNRRINSHHQEKNNGDILMPSERENINSVLSAREYDIAGNVFRAYYDVDGKLVFVLDYTIDDRKPNVLLVINPVGDRKWDDILVNDYNLDLETVRPKKDNKYQKLDIEYSGLAQYDNLIQAYENKSDLTDALGDLVRFRNASIRRAAGERLALAESGAARARDTIARANDSMDELRARLKQLRAKLAQQKKRVGREPTKQSAAKILKTDAQIDAVNEKLKRAKKRLENAQRRLVVADADAEIARDILARTPEYDNVNTTSPIRRPDETETAIVPNFTSYDVSYDMGNGDDADDENKKDTDSGQDDDVEYQYAYETTFATPDDDTRDKVMASGAEIDNNVARMPVESYVPDDNADNAEYTEDENYKITQPERGGTVMPDNKDDVKPLFDKNPETLDEEIAFKPIEFGVSSPVPDVPRPSQAETENTMNTYGNNMDSSPLSFVPPVSNVENSNTGADQPLNVRPVIDNTPQNFGEQMPSRPAMDAISSANASGSTNDAFAPAMDTVRPEAVMPNVGGVDNNALGEMNGGQNMANATLSHPGTSAPRPVVPGVPAASDVRPLSPITGAATPTVPATHKPTLIYYIMLLVLIVVSVFTLWLYQRNMGDKTPDLAATVPEENAPDTAASETGEPSPFIAEVAEEETVDVVQVEPAPVVEPEPVPEPAPTPVVEPAPVVEPEPVPEPAPAPVVEPEPVVVPEPVPAPVSEPVSEPEIPSEEEILASKPAYNVSQNENMFVADPEYETDVPYSGAETVETVETTEYVSEVSESLPTCPDGAAADANGCCPGEIYTDMGVAGFNCCPENGGDCFPPLF